MARMNELDKIVRNLVLLDVWVSLLTRDKDFFRFPNRVFLQTYLLGFRQIFLLKGRRCCMVIEDGEGLLCAILGIRMALS